MSSAAPPRRRWSIAVVAASVALAVAIATTVWWITSGSQAWARHRWQPPQQALLMSLRAQPVPGWKTDVAALGLPPGSTMAKDDRYPERWPHPLSGGESGSDTYLLAANPRQDGEQWWLVGIDARTGHALFKPVALNQTQGAPECFRNDPLDGPAIVCIADDYRSATAWIVDSRTGQVTFTGPTDLRLRPGDTMLAPVQVGNYLLGAVKGQGVYGVGSHAETTWFVPGAGWAQAGEQDIAFLGGAKGQGTMVASLRDGKVIAPELPVKSTLGAVREFDSGFAGNVFTDSSARSVVQFFDATGQLASNRQVSGDVGGTTGNLVGVSRDDGSYGVYGPTGVQLLELAHAPQGMQLIGTTLYVGEGESDVDYPLSRAIDMRTGASGRLVKIDFGRRYLGTDGTVALRAVVNPKADGLAKAYDLTSGDLLWTIPSKPDSLGRLYLVDTTLVQVSDDGTELWSLVPPS